MVGLSRADGNAVHQDCRVGQGRRVLQRVKSRAPHRTAAGNHDHVGRFQGLSALFHEIVAVVPRRCRIPPGPLRPPVPWLDRLRVLMSRICPLAGNPIHRYHFVTGGDDAHHGAPENADFHQPAGRPAGPSPGGGSAFLWSAPVRYDGCLRPFRSHAGPGPRSGRPRWWVSSSAIGVLDHDDAVGPLGEHAAGWRSWPLPRGPMEKSGRLPILICPRTVRYAGLASDAPKVEDALTANPSMVERLNSGMSTSE